MTLENVVSNKCVEYGVTLKELCKLGFQLKTADELRAEDRLEQNILVDPNLLGSLMPHFVRIDGSESLDDGSPVERHRLFWDPKRQFAFGADIYKKKRYRSPLGTSSHGYLCGEPKELTKFAEDISVPLILVEGELKSVGLAIDGHFTCAIQGLDNLMPHGRLVPELENVKLKGRTVKLAIDSDWATKLTVQAAGIRLGFKLQSLGCKVEVIDWSEDFPDLKGIDELRSKVGTELCNEFIEAAKSFDDWLMFDLNSQSVPRDTITNIKLAMAQLGWRFRRNEMSPVGYFDARPSGEACYVHSDDEHIHRLRSEIAHRFKFDASPAKLETCMVTEAAANTFHPVRDYLDGLTWDSVARLDSWLSEVFKIEDTELHRAYAKNSLIAGIARAYDPGCKVDESLLIGGAQEIGKSSAIQMLCPEPDLFAASLNMAKDDKVIIEQTNGKWICELAEFDRMVRGSDASVVKANLSRQVDESRMAYARRTTVRPRMFICFGTTNEKEWGQDETGLRRNPTVWSPIPRGELVNFKWLEEHRDLLWAEARERYFNGEPWWLEDAELKRLARESEGQFMAGSNIRDILEDQLGREAPGRIFKETIWLLLTTHGIKRDNAARHELKRAMINLGFEEPRSGIRIQGVNSRGMKNAQAGYERSTDKWARDEETWWALDAKSDASTITTVLDYKRGKRDPGGRKNKVTKMPKAKKY